MMSTKKGKNLNGWELLLGRAQILIVKLWRKWEVELSNEKEKEEKAVLGCVSFQNHLSSCFVDEDSKVERLPYSWFKGGFKPGLFTDLCWKLTPPHTVLTLPLTHQWNIIGTLFFIWHLGFGSIKMHVPSGCDRAFSCHQCRGRSFSLFSLPIWFPPALGSWEKRL